MVETSPKMWVNIAVVSALIWTVVAVVRLDEFDEHATGFHVTSWPARHPDGTASASVSVKLTSAAHTVPPAAVPRTAAHARSTELSSVGAIVRMWRNHHGVAGVSAVPVHRQPIPVGLIAEQERRVFRRVPSSVSTIDLGTKPRQKSVSDKQTKQNDKRHFAITEWPRKKTRIKFNAPSFYNSLPQNHAACVRILRNYR